MSGKPYPTAPQANSYPGQTSYPTAHGQYPQPQYQTSSPYQQQQQHPYGQPGGGMYAAPPPYTSQPQEPPPPYTQYPNQAQMYGHAQSGVPHPQTSYPQQQPPTTVMVPGLYDASARFDGIAQPRLPPPPPGVMPNAAQLAAMQGHNIVGSQQRSNWFTGSGGGSDWGL